MEVTVDTYRVSKGNTDYESIIKELENDFNLISNILQVSEYANENTSIESFFEDIEEYPVLDSLPYDVIDKLQQFSVKLFNVNSIPKYQPDTETVTKVFKIRKLLGEQLEYFYSEDSDCNIWAIVAKINGIIYGTIFVFYNPNVSSDILIQGISRAFIPSLYEILSPGALSNLPRLNSLLFPSIETIAKSVGASKIFVAPIGNQGNILQKHYGFQPDNTIIFPCSIILGSGMITNNLEYFPTYSKLIDYSNDVE